MEKREPSYRKLHAQGELRRRADLALEMLSDCRMCPRDCGANRLGGQRGFCRTGREARVASYSPHFGEEAPLVGTRGSGTVFFSSCNLLCSFCQNYDISEMNSGQEVDAEELARIMLGLEGYGCHNINLVTPTHVVPQILEALVIAAGEGLGVPLVYNTGAYECVETLELLDGVVDIYMPDFKFWDRRWGLRFCRAGDYRDRAAEAIREMHRQVGDLVTDGAGIAVRGLIVRHLVMPGGIAGSENVMEFLAGEISPDTYVNVMGQYRPCGTARADSVADRRPTLSEMEEARDAAIAAGLTRLD